MEKLNQTRFILDDWLVTPAEGLLSRADEVVRLEPKVMEVLVYFASHPGQVISREELERDVWRGALVSYDSVTAAVIKLRKALKDSAKQPRLIATIPKRGYQLIAPIHYLDSEDNAEKSKPVVIDSGATPTQHHPQQQSLRPARLIGLAMIAVAGVVALVLAWQSLSSSPPARENNSALPSIVVLPFENLSSDAKHDNFVDGITEDIVTDLSRLSNLMVMASNTSFQYKGRLVSPQDIRTELKVDFVLKGNIRRSGDKLRINAQLIDTKTGFNTWAERYDRDVAKVFIVREEVTNSIVKALAVNITSQEKKRLIHKTTDNLKAYDFFQEGQRISKISTKETNQQAREVYRKAIELDPTYGRAYGALAYSLAFSYRRGWTDAPVESLDRALALAMQAITHDDSIPQTWWALGFVYLMRKEFDQAEKAVAQAINIAPNYADGYGLLALINNNLGKPKTAIKLINRGMHLNPYYTWDYPYNLGCAYYMLGDYEAAIIELEKAQERNENAIPIKLYLAASYTKAGRQDDAEWVTEQLQILSPTATITHTEKTVPIVNSAIKRTLLEDLRKAGLPE
ncbi:MAG: winged helix-turn-helix domain-containing protein [Porticoccus sp.]|nr:winged helix-turn-helix domain-containing protein [Porticoccus sp.]